MSQILSLILAFSLHAQAQETTVSPATVAVEEPSQNYETTVRSASFQSTSKIIIDEKTIKDSKAPNIATLLATQANIAIAGTNLQPNTIFLRGGDSSHLLILVDGVPFFDPSTSQKTTNLNSFDIKTIRRIEVLKGSQSVLYGGQALTGVIKIETFPVDLKNKTYAAVEGGNSQYGKVSAAGLLANKAEDAGVLARGRWSQKMTPSPIKNSSEIYPSYLTGGDVAYISRGQYTYFAKYSQVNERSDLTNFNNTTRLPEDATNYKHNGAGRSVTAGFSMPMSSLRPRLVLGQQDFLRTYEFGTTKQHYGSVLTHVRGELDLVNNESANLLLGTSYQKETYVERQQNTENFDLSAESKGVFAKWTQDFGSLLGYEVGLRSDFASKQNRADSMQFGLILLERLKLEYATAFKSPSLFQLYGGTYGNADLAPEKSRTYSLTYEENSDDQSMSATIFDTSFDDLIGTVGSMPPNIKYYNLSRAHVRGMELAYAFTNENRLKWLANFGYQEPRDVTNAKWLARRPLLTASMGLVQQWDKSSVGAEIVHTGERSDRVLGAPDKQLASRTVLNLNYTHNLNSQFSVYARGNNVTDQKFEQTANYYDEGFFGLVGLEFQN